MWLPMWLNSLTHKELSQIPWLSREAEEDEEEEEEDDDDENDVERSK